MSPPPYIRHVVRFLAEVETDEAETLEQLLRRTEHSAEWGRHRHDWPMVLDLIEDGSLTVNMTVGEAKARVKRMQRDRSRKPYP